MNETEHLLTVLIEECSEVQKACTKALRFGLDDTWPGPESGLPEWTLTPRQEIQHELNDVAGVCELLRQRNILPGRNESDAAEMMAKMLKVQRLMPYAQKAGTLINLDPDELFAELCPLFDEKAAKLHKMPGQFTHHLATVAILYMLRKLKMSNV